LRTSPPRDDWKKENWYYAQFNDEIHIQEQAQKCLHIEFFRGFQSALKALQNLIAPQEFGSIRVEVRSAANEGMGEAQSSSARHFAFFIFT
jgi:hypothetical protein